MTPTFANEINSILPLLVLGGGALLILLLEVCPVGKWSRSWYTIIVLMGALCSCMTAAIQSQYGKTVFSGILYADPFTYFLTLILLGGSLFAAFLSSEKLEQEGVEQKSEYFALLLMSTFGAIVFVSAAELITFFLGLEIMSMALYCLCGSALLRRQSAESALKYFLLGSFSSAFLLYGIALLYGLTGSTEIQGVAAALDGAPGTILYFAMGLVLVGIVFKIGLVPFHFWAPDVYQGSPTAVTAYMACVVKAAAVGAGLRMLWILFADYHHYWQGAVWIIAVLTLIVGNLVALRQKSLKRMLAYSSIGHAGYIFLGFLAPAAASGAGAAILYYLIVYTLMTMGAFGVVLALSAGKPNDSQADSLSRLHGFGYTNPVLGALLCLFMLSLAGIPPGMGGLLGKVYIFSSIVSAGYVGAAIVGVLCAAVACFYYLRVIVAMYFIEPDTESEVLVLDSSLLSVLIICALGIVLLGLFPSLIYEGAAGVIQGF